MKFDKERHLYVLSTGTCIEANEGILGIGCDVSGSSEISIYGGYDDLNNVELSDAERVELAEFAIARWKEFASLP